MVRSRNSTWNFSSRPIFPFDPFYFLGSYDSGAEFRWSRDQMEKCLAPDGKMRAVRNFRWCDFSIRHQHFSICFSICSPSPANFLMEKVGLMENLLTWRGENGIPSGAQSRLISISILTDCGPAWWKNRWKSGSDGKFCWTSLMIQSYSIVYAHL